MPTFDANRSTWTEYDWVHEGGEEWSSAWGGSRMLWSVTIFPRLCGFLPAKRVLEIAPGGGRVTAFLLNHCERIDLVDISRTALDACRRRFRWRRGIRYHLGDGKGLDCLGDATIDLAFSWDSLVHAEAEAIQGYVSALARKLRPGGVAVLHHSNLGACRLPDGRYAEDMDRPERGWRAVTVSADLVRVWAEQAGLVCMGQEIFPWSRPNVESDCLSVLARTDAQARAPDAVPRIDHVDMPAEMARASRIASLYRRP